MKNKNTETNLNSNTEETRHFSITKTLTDLFSKLSFLNPFATSFSNFESFELSIEQEDINGECFTQSEKFTTKFMNKYSHEEVLEMFEKHKVIKQLKKKNIHPRLQIETSERYSHELVISEMIESKPENALVRLIVSPQPKFFPEIKHKTIRNLEVGDQLFRDELMNKIKILDIKWLSIQNTKSHFTKNKPQYPGQKFPGLGLLRKMYFIILEFSMSDGISGLPMHFHNAIFSKGSTFVNPCFQGWFESLQEDLAQEIEEHGLARVSWAIFLGGLRDKDHNLVLWEPEEMLFGMSETVKEYFNSKKYIKLFQQNKYSRGNYIDWKAVEKDIPTKAF
ncbi:hypothetical protein M0812_29672 [Anaeramoeba flamelloides]|uniref:Uncharacterized protein n=1 Tax=Anaeramoeba flamelloides TaxID=1746091 RepID=A0AAV7Y5B5_9EUKA|nr:hypothetical protein M0812_29672 [Anaeramoeba flamelloides]